MERVSGRLLEAVLEIERFRTLVFGVHEQNPYADCVGRVNAPEEGILQKRWSEPNATVSVVAGQTRQQNRWHRAALRLALERPRCRFFRRD